MESYEHGGNIYKAAKAIGILPNDLIDFSANINPLGPSQMGLKHMQEAFKYLTAYPDPEYFELKKAISGYTKTSLNYISVNNGAIEGLHEVIRFLKPQKALLIAPCFVEYEKALKAVDSDVHFFVTKTDTQFDISSNELIHAINELKPDLLVLCTPNNPTGTVSSYECISRYAEVLSSFGGSLIIDEAFVDFLGNDASCVFEDKLFKDVPHGNIYVSRSFTKFFGVPGLRLGALFSNNEKYNEWRRLHSVPWNVNVFAEWYALGALNDVDYISQTIAFVKLAREELFEALSEISPVQVFEGQADYLLFRMRLFQEDLDRFKDFMAAKGLLLRQCGNYVGLNESYFRVAVKSIEANAQLIQGLKEFQETCSKV